MSNTFVDFRAIKASVSMEAILVRYGVFETLHGSGDTRRGPCPIHGGSNKNQFSVNLAKNIWNCFSDCKGGGNVLDFVAKRERVDIHKAALLLCEWFNLKSAPSAAQPASPKSDSQSPAKSSTSPAKTDDKEPNKPLGFELKDLQPEHPYLAQRGITPQVAAEFGLGFFPGSKGLMVGRIVIPIHNCDGKLVAYAGRFPGDPPNEETPRYKFPPGFKKGLELYNIHRISQQAPDQPLFVVEGFFGCIHLWSNGARRVVAIMGSHLSSEQETLILHHTSDRTQIIIMLDENEAGRVGRVDIAARLSLHRLVRIQTFTKENQQPTDLSGDEIRKLLTADHVA